jgi:hypothetical protein
VQRNQLAAEQILPRRDARRDGDCLHAAGRDEAVDAPFARGVEAVFGDLEPTRCGGHFVSATSLPQVAGRSSNEDEKENVDERDGIGKG